MLKTRRSGCGFRACVRLCLVMLLVGCDSGNVELQPERPEAEATQESAPVPAKVVPKGNKKSQIYLRNSNRIHGIFDDYFYWGDTRTVGLKDKTYCEETQWHASVTFQSVEVNALTFPFQHSAPDQCEARIELPPYHRPMWMRIDVVRGDDPAKISMETACVYVTDRNIAIMDVGDSSLTSADTMSGYPRGSWVVNKDFARHSCSHEDYFHLYRQN